MKVEIKEENAKYAKIVLSGISAGFANAIRRAASNSVLCFAIDKAIFYENTSAMFDEYIAQRVGLIPIITPSKGYNESDEILFNLDATGPVIVYSRDLKSTDGTIVVANQNIPIMKLGIEQRLRFDGKAILGNGEKHAKFRAGLISFNMIDPQTYEFYIETFGQMPPKEIMIKAIESLTERLKEAKKLLK